MADREVDTQERDVALMRRALELAAFGPLVDPNPRVGAVILDHEGMVVGEYSRESDLDVNICREKKLSNMRASGHDEAVRLTPHREMGLETGIEWIGDEELVEVTPQSVRLRKKVLRQTERPKRRKE